jgi:hypothetical protein
VVQDLQAEETDMETILEQEELMQCLTQVQAAEAAEQTKVVLESARLPIG